MGGVNMIQRIDDKFEFQFFIKNIDTIQKKEELINDIAYFFAIKWGINKIIEYGKEIREITAKSNEEFYELLKNHLIKNIEFSPEIRVEFFTRGKVEVCILKNYESAEIGISLCAGPKEKKKKRMLLNVALPDFVILRSEKPRVVFNAFKKFAESLYDYLKEKYGIGILEKDRHPTEKWVNYCSFKETEELIDLYEEFRRKEREKKDKK